MIVTEQKNTEGATIVTVEFEPAEAKAMESLTEGIGSWVKAVVGHKVNRSVDQCFEETSDFQPSKKSTEEKLLHLKITKVKKREERNFAL